MRHPPYGASCEKRRHSQFFTTHGERLTMVTDYRRLIGTVGTVLSLGCVAQCFVAHNSFLGVSGRVGSAPSERTCSVAGGRREGALRMEAESECVRRVDRECLSLCSA